MTPIQQLMLGAGGKKKIYVDNVFSTYLYKGTGNQMVINNGIDLSNEGGLVWTKNRDVGYSNFLFDTERGTTKIVISNNTSSEGTESPGVNAFNSNGFSVGTNGVNDGAHNHTSYRYSSWTFRKAPGFFDIQTYTGGGANTSGSIGNPNFKVFHDLKCVPGLILIKRTNATTNWLAWHKGEEGVLNTTGTFSGASALPLADVTDTYFKFSAGNGAYNDPGTFVAYIFAGGFSPADSARSVDFDGTGDYLSISDHADFNFGNGNFCVELWIKGTANNANRNIIGQWAPGQMGWSVYWSAANQGHSAWGFKYSPDGTNEYQVSDILLDDDQWHHIAVVRDGNDVKLYRDGKYRATLDVTDVTFHDSTAELRIANDGWNSPLDCHISNVRVVKGSSVYTTTTYRIPTEPLTNITNTKLLCCNGTSTTSSTVTPGTITANGNPTSSTVTPFDDPAGFVFGGKENIIKCGSYVGNASTDGPEVYVGWEPQWILIKNADATEGWRLFDSMRGIANGTDSNDGRLFPNDADAESAADDYIDLTPTGFQLKDTGAAENGDGNTLLYVAIRRPDGYVGKPADAGTDVFAMDTGAGGTTIPNYDTGFPVDMAFDKKPDSVAQWYLSTRLTGKKYLRPDHTTSFLSQANYTWDSNVGWGDGSWQDSTYQSWMFKRHAGFDVTTWVGEGGNRQLPHSLNQIPEMIWVKRGDDANDWSVYHKDLNGGTDAADYHLHLNTTAAEYAAPTMWNDSAPTKTYFNIGSHPNVNANGTHTRYTACLFASVAGISKVGSYTGAGSSDKTVTVGFQPRLIIIKNADTTTEWGIYDTLRGINSSGSGGDHFLYLNETNAQWDDLTHIDLTSTGFTLKGNSWNGINQDTHNFIYYAHA